MPNNGSISETMDGIDVKTITIPSGYTSGGTVSLDNTIDNEVKDQAELIAQIQTALEGKTAVSDITLPTLSNPATSENLEEGYELIDGNGNIVVGTHVCSGGSGSGDIMYFTVQNNLPDDLIVGGIDCAVGECTPIPYNENYSLTLFMIPSPSDSYSVYAPYTIISEDENGEPFEEEMNGAPIYAIQEVFGFITGTLMDFNPDYAVNKTITFEAVY